MSGREHLAGIAEVAARRIEILCHHAQVRDFVRPARAHLAKHLLDTHVGAGVARAVVPGKEQLEFFARLPRTGPRRASRGRCAIESEHDPCFKKEIGHRRNPSVLPTPAAAASSRTGATGRAIPGTDREMVIAAESQQRIAILEKTVPVARPISATIRELSNTVSHTRYGRKTFSSDALRLNLP